jgi:hypothetical protein
MVNYSYKYNKLIYLNKFEFYNKLFIKMLLEEYLKQKFKENNININLYIKMQNLELIKYMSKKEKIDFKEIFKKYIN